MGIGQLFKKREEPQEEENLKEMFENIKSQEIPHQTAGDYVHHKRSEISSYASIRKYNI